MPATDLTTGYFGKIPATGDFVGRRLPAGFVRVWDRWVVRNLTPLVAEGIWPDHVGLRFLIGPAASGPMAGVVLPSADRVGRRFPLTVASPTLAAAAGYAASAAPWFDRIERAAAAARDGELDADGLAGELAGLAFPQVDPEGETVPGMAFWTSRSQLVAVDQDAPRAALEHLLAASWETS